MRTRTLDIGRQKAIRLLRGKSAIMILLSRSPVYRFVDSADVHFLLQLYCFSDKTSDFQYRQRKLPPSKKRNKQTNKQASKHKSKKASKNNSNNNNNNNNNNSNNNNSNNNNTGDV
ncbi:protein ecdysoneless homolog [Aplysia californica]|uniref:Protein ecdysoneless homolog n=1 Tax=Aplysia californica TaxID=6500 RepID=A0ABM1VQP3_APLCA|nr:protein ecdysoneless homolog [Aplysia californica]